jgi:charged multivesicular body protein 5
MQRIFGKKKEEGPAPSLADAGGRVDARVKGLDDKIKALDQELLRYKTALQKAKGPTAVNIKVRTPRSSLLLASTVSHKTGRKCLMRVKHRLIGVYAVVTQVQKRAMDTLKRKKMYESQRDQLAGQQFNIEQTSFTVDSIRDTQVLICLLLRIPEAVAFIRVCLAYAFPAFVRAQLVLPLCDWCIATNVALRRRLWQR